MNVTYEPANPKPTNSREWDFALERAVFFVSVDGVDVYREPPHNNCRDYDDYFLVPNPLDTGSPEFSYVSPTAIRTPNALGWKRMFPRGPLEFLHILHKLNK